MDFEKLRMAADIVDVAENLLKLPTQRSGNMVSILCPLHGDRHFGSCYLYQDTNVAHCYVCNRSIDAIDLVYAVKSAEDPGFRKTDAIRLLGEYYGIDDKTPQKPQKALVFQVEDFRAAGVYDVQGLKGIFKENQKLFWEWLTKTFTRAIRKYENVCRRQDVPAEVIKIAQARIKKLSELQKSFAAQSKQTYDILKFKGEII